MGVGLATYSEAIMRALLFTLMFAATPCYADNWWGDYGPSGYDRRDDYLIYGSPSQQLNNIEIEMQYERMRNEQYQKEVLEEMRESNRLTKKRLQQQEDENRFRDLDDF